MASASSKRSLESLLQGAACAVQGRFDSEKRVLSFEEYLGLVQDNPKQHCRDAARYVLDALDHFGSSEVSRVWGKSRRYHLFDLPFVDTEGRRSDRLVGHEALQESFYRALRSFRREGRVHRLILLHGPNGSAKSTFVRCLAAGLEAYSESPGGALYRFSWVFPRGEGNIGFSRVGFGAEENDSEEVVSTFAHLPEERIDAKMVSELREHPLLLLPIAERRSLLDQLECANPPDLLWTGGLGHKNRQIFDTLLTAYRGDLRRVLAHVQVERYGISRRYRVGMVTIGPEMSVDARERQLTADRSINALPPSLSATALFETSGELVDGAGGITEFSDLLKRPLDAWKYLLVAIESGEVALQMSNLQLNSVLIASSNERHLKAFQEHPEYHSFRGRLLPLRVPYLRDVAEEQGIYDAQIVPRLRVHVAPHATYVAALWAILTRLRRADSERYTPVLGQLAKSLTPIEKAELYSLGQVPSRLDAEQAKILREAVAQLVEEQGGTMNYEGLFGASPREMRGILHAAAEAEYLSPVTVLEQLEAFCERDDYVFLRIKPDGAYHDARGAVQVVRERWLDRVDDELRQASGLLDETEVLSLFDRYVTHVSHQMKGERIRNAVTGVYETPDDELMERVEKTLDATNAHEFRRELLSQVATWVLDHPNQELDHHAAFASYITAMEDAYFQERKARLTSLGLDMVRLARGDTADITDLAAAQPAFEEMLKLGYAPNTLGEALSVLLEKRYR